MRALPPQAHTRVGKWEGQGSNKWAELLKPSEEEEEGHWSKTKAEENHLALHTRQQPVSYHPEVLPGGICSFGGEILFSGGFFGFHISSDLGTGWMLPWSCPPMPVSLSELSASFWWEKRDESWQGGRLEDVDRNDARSEDERRRTYSCHGLRKYHGPAGKSYIVLTRTLKKKIPFIVNLLLRFPKPLLPEPLCIPSQLGSWKTWGRDVRVLRKLY